ncbi:hypothetical protein DEU56DRAFT_782559 [Suillus clintonianus]|uniref:uncharacterized protein n=1 Tax=Suillus clintonianus TaxID=1904413 RepID=UPI001B868067|nr:uncharacterized protein DEU56DRAFT_782559 [Suillus clintonianus]KAG2148865.1 hypothetical protein DEU56DRAFT_782559 [Suillus clintonianus]
MSDAVGTCCALGLTACCDVLAGICIDFMSMRHPCTEHLCSCCSCSKAIDDTILDVEREPLICEDRQPSPHPPMQSTESS